RKARPFTWWAETFPAATALVRDAGDYHPQSPHQWVKANNLYADGSVDWHRRHPVWELPAIGGRSGGLGSTDPIGVSPVR
ncbi:MAG: hypothetical protein ACF8R7_09965, partial [Phycisphaerales bacterium JB039]